MKVSIIAPEKKVYEGSASAITLPSVNGAFTALENHAPIVALLEKGQIILVPKEGEDAMYIAILGGFAEIRDNQVSACVEVEAVAEV